MEDAAYLIALTVADAIVIILSKDGPTPPKFFEWVIESIPDVFQTCFVFSVMQSRADSNKQTSAGEAQI